MEREPTGTDAVEVSPDRLGTVGEPARRERYADEAARLAGRHDPDDEA